MDLSTAKRIFELGSKYTKHEVKTVYKRLALKHHPDRNGNSSDSIYFMQQINEAYELLIRTIDDESAAAPDDLYGTQSEENSKTYGAGRERKHESSKSAEQKEYESEQNRRRTAEQEKQEAKRKRQQAAERERKYREEQEKKKKR